MTSRNVEKGTQVNLKGCYHVASSQAAAADVWAYRLGCSRYCVTSGIQSHAGTVCSRNPEASSIYYYVPRSSNRRNRRGHKTCSVYDVVVAIIMCAEGGNRLRYVIENGRCRALKPASQCPDGLFI